MTAGKTRILHVVGTRPNFMKIAPVVAAIDKWNENLGALRESLGFDQCLVHTGQHYDALMSSIFFADLGLREPDAYLDVRSGSQATQTANLMLALEPLLQSEKPDLVVVVGDVNSTLAAAIVAAKLGIPVAHVESGLRSGDWSMPEEINRMLADRISRLLFTTSAEATDRLVREGTPESSAHFVGNTMIDSLQATLPIARKRAAASRLRLPSRGFALVTLHRPSNVDDLDQLSRMVDVLLDLAERIPVVFPIHARTRACLQVAGFVEKLTAHAALTILPPLGYIDFLSLMSDARVVLTDSGGIQAETCVVGTPCITTRTTTEWVETLQAGLNTLVDPYDGQAMARAVRAVLSRPLPSSGNRPELWDGHAAERIVAVIAEWAGGRG
jgi:UDP-N-acetylglucosamine 2-epimerase (non-hydrolysing)